MKKTIMEMNSKYLLLWCCLWMCTTATAQWKEYPDIYPPLPFDLNLATELGNIKCIIWKGTYAKTEGDVTGSMWSNTIENSYQYQRYVFPEGNMDMISSYIPSGDKEWTMEVFYKQGHLSAIEKLKYDSLQESSLDCAYSYFYQRDSTPFQRVTLFGWPYKDIRLLDEFVFDSLNRMIRQKTTAVGKSPYMDSLVGLKDKEKFLTLTEYGDLTLSRRVYKNLYVIMSDSKIFYDTRGFPKYEEIRNADGKILITIKYITDAAGRVIRKTHWVTREPAVKEAPKEENEKKKKKKKPKKADEAATIDVNVPLEEPKPEVYKLEYFTYTAEGLLEKHIIEENGIQTVLEYTYFTE